MEFHSLKVALVKNLTKDSVQITFDIPEELKPEFQFSSGQYITLEINGERRDYSLCSSPLDSEWSIGVRAVKGGNISKYLTQELKTGDVLSVSTPNGRFGIPSKPNEKRTLLAFAAGSGITPILSIIRYTLETEEWVNFYLFFSNKTPEKVMFMEELKALQKLYPNNFHLHLFYTQFQMEDWLFEGRLDEHKFELILNQLVDINEVDEAMVCGPSEMIKVISNEIFNAGIPKKHIHFELFTPEFTPLDILPEEMDAPDDVNVTVELEGETHELVWNREKNLIDAMLDADIDAPYSCKGGICSSCMCKLEEGEVHLGDNYVLTDSDREEGIILACISRPKTPTIKINFDAI
ncbi:MAG: 2Fe-2S iron-sulfur cluster binding domain-containing protein [Flavobacteriaceae bacterium]|jgi:ring-1,2-phenylacetyl-CoA epoxidase subunit PaaE|nr:2Fe-2S iron-sulfur cluster binding domain-containing protein [Flavobacteriaceae bacterium]